jgi:hypothetical protein
MQVLSFLGRLVSKYAPTMLTLVIRSTSSSSPNRRRVPCDIWWTPSQSKRLGLEVSRRLGSITRIICPWLSLSQYLQIFLGSLITRRIIVSASLGLDGLEYYVRTTHPAELAPQTLLRSHLDSWVLNRFCAAKTTFLARHVTKRATGVPWMYYRTHSKPVLRNFLR